MNIPEGISLERLLFAVGGILGAIGLAWKTRRGMSKDQLETQKNVGEGGWINQVSRERDEALVRERATMAEHIRVLEENAGLKLQHAFAVERLERLEREFRLIKRLLVEARPDLAVLLNTGFSELNDENVGERAAR